MSSIKESHGMEWTLVAGFDRRCISNIISALAWIRETVKAESRLETTSIISEITLLGVIKTLHPIL